MKGRILRIWAACVAAAVVADGRMRPRKKTYHFSPGKNRPLTNRPMRRRREAMKGRILRIWVACVAAAVVAALAQFNADPAEDPTAVDKSKPATVATPTSDAEANEAGKPLATQVPGGSPRTDAGATMQPTTEGVADEAIIADQAMISEEAGRRHWRVIPLFSAGLVYDDNIFFSNTDRVADVIWMVSFGLAFELGDFRSDSENFVTGSWIGIPVIYTENSGQNAFNQSASLSAQYRWNKLVGNLDSRFSIVKGANREVNTITSTTSFWNALRFHYDYSEKTTFNLEFAQTASLVETFQNQYQYEAKAGMDYQLFPKTKVGFEGVGGVLDSTSNPLQYYQQARVRVNYSATGKLNFKFSGGVEFREFEGGVQPVKINPVFSLGVEYHPFDGTTFSVVGYRNIVAATALAGQDLTATGFEISAQQRFVQKFIAGFSFGYENDRYFGTTAETPNNRVDNYIFVRPKLSYTFIEWLSANVFYEYRQSASTPSINSFYDNRIGMELATRF